MANLAIHTLNLLFWCFISAYNDDIVQLTVPQKNKIKWTNRNGSMAIVLNRLRDTGLEWQRFWYDTRQSYRSIISAVYSTIYRFRCHLVSGCVYLISSLIDKHKIFRWEIKPYGHKTKENSSVFKTLLKPNVYQFIVLYYVVLSA